jgi:hypothetical protein
MTNNFREKANFIWQVADDTLRFALSHSEANCCECRAASQMIFDIHSPSLKIATLLHECHSKRENKN